jgi:hypothetical protein
MKYKIQGPIQGPGIAYKIQGPGMAYEIQGPSMAYKIQGPIQGPSMAYKIQAPGIAYVLLGAFLFGWKIYYTARARVQPPPPPLWGRARDSNEPSGPLRRVEPKAVVRVEVAVSPRPCLGCAVELARFFRAVAGVGSAAAAPAGARRNPRRLPGPAQPCGPNKSPLAFFGGGGLYTASARAHLCITHDSR